MEKCVETSVGVVEMRQRVLKYVWPGTYGIVCFVGYSNTQAFLQNGSDALYTS